MKEKVVLRIVTVAALIVAAATLVQAGAGGGVNLIPVNLECLSIGGSENLGEIVRINNPGFSQTVLHPTVRVNNAVLSCRQVDVYDSNGGFVSPVGGDHLKCYSISTPGSQSAPQNFGFTDEFLSETVRVSAPSAFLCTTAGVTF